MKEQRTGPDAILNIISGIAVILWIIVVLVVILFAVANPTNPGMAAVRSGLKSSGKWASGIIYGLLIIQIILSVSGMIFSKMRMKRKTDRMRITLVLSALLGICGIILIIV